MEHLVNNKNSLLLMRIVLTSVFKHISLFDFENAPIRNVNTPPPLDKNSQIGTGLNQLKGGGVKVPNFPLNPPFFFLDEVFLMEGFYYLCVLENFSYYPSTTVRTTLE